MQYTYNDGNGPEQQPCCGDLTNLTNIHIRLPTLLSLVRVWRPAVLAGVAGAGHGLLGLVGALLPGLLLAGDRRGGRQGKVGRLCGTQGAQVVSAQAGRQGQRVLEILLLLMWSAVVCCLCVDVWCGGVV